MRQSSERQSTDSRHRTRRRTPTVVLFGCILAVAGPVVFIAGSNSSDGPDAGERLVAAVFLVLLAVALFVLIRNLAGFEPDFDDERDGAGVVATSEERVLVARWLVRARWARGLGGACGIVLWVFGANAQGDVLLLGIGGVSMGAVFSELHRVAPSRARTAGLDVRTVGNYLDRRGLRCMRIAAATTTIAAVVSAAATAWVALVWAGAAAVALVALAIVQRRVAARPRPALGARMRSADDLVRSLAISRGLAVPGAAIAVVLSAHAMLVLADTYEWANAVAIAFWLGAVVMWWRDRGLRLASFAATPGLAAA